MITPQLGAVIWFANKQTIIWAGVSHDDGWSSLPSSLAHALALAHAHALALAFPALPEHCTRARMRMGKEADFVTFDICRSRDVR